MINFKSLFVLWINFFLLFQIVSGQVEKSFIFTKGDNDISTITMGSERSPHCTVIEYPEFLVLHEVPNIPVEKDSTKMVDDSHNPLIAFLDSAYSNKPIKYILNSHSHGHSLSTVLPFIERGAKLITAAENIEVYNKKGLFGDKTSVGYAESIIEISSDTVLLTDTDNPIKVLYLKKSDYTSIPTKTYLFFNFPKHKLLAASCMVYLKDIDTQYGYKAIVYSGRLLNVNKIIEDKNLEVDKTLQLYKFSNESGVRKPPVFSMYHIQNVLEHSWHREELSEHFQNMTYEELTTKKDSVLNYLVESQIYHIIVNHAVYELIEKKEYKKAVALAHILVVYTPDNIDYIDSLGECYFNNGQLNMANYYDKILSKSEDEGLGMAIWEANQKERLKKDS